MHKSQALKPSTSANRQNGFSLIEISIGLILVVGIVVSFFQISEHRARIEQAKTVADDIKSVNEAVATYAGNLSNILSDKNLPVACEANYYGVVDADAPANSVNVVEPPSSCSKDLGTGAQQVTVRNVMQPTLDELKQLNYLKGPSSFVPPFVTDNRVVYKDSNNNNAFLPPGYAVQITRVCVNNPSAAVDSANYCTTPNPGYFDLQTLVFSSQPFSDKAIKNGGVSTMLYTAYSAVGADALLAADGITKTTNGNADITHQYPLVPPNSNGQTFLANPLQNSAGVGVKNILAMRGGYSSSVRSNYVRPDGLTPMSGGLEMGNNSISQVKDISATGDIKTPNGTITGANIIASTLLTATAINTSSLTSSGNIKGFNFLAENQIRANDRIFAGSATDASCDVSQAEHGSGAGDINACRDMVAKGYVKGFGGLQAGAMNNVGVRLNSDGSIEGKTLNVDSSKNVSNINNITQSGGIKSQGIIETTQDFITAAGKKVQAGYFKFLNTAAEGAACASDFTNSLTLDTTNNNKLLRCDSTTSKWVSMLQKGDTGVPGVPGAPGANYYDNTLTSESVNFIFTELSGSGNTNWACDKWTKPGISKFLVGKPEDDYQINIQMKCISNEWQVEYLRQDLKSLNINVEVTSIKKNNGYGITVSDDLDFPVSMYGNDTGERYTVTSKYPPYTTRLDPWYLAINRNFSWWVGLISPEKWRFFANQRANSGGEKGSIGWTALTFNGPVTVDYAWLEFSDRDTHDTNLSCANWTKPVITGIWGGERWDADLFKTWCEKGNWYVNATQKEANINSGWLSYKINAKFQ